MRKELYLAGGCFWGVEKYLSCFSGVESTSVGYANGETENPTYMEVCCMHTGHAETVKVVYDDELLSLSRLLEVFFRVVNPTALNRQGPDRGRQYRSGIYYIDAAERPTIEAFLKKLQERWEKPVVTEVLPLVNFYPAEEYHQKYLDKNPHGYCHIPKEAFEWAKGS